MLLCGVMGAPERLGAPGWAGQPAGGDACV